MQQIRKGDNRRLMGEMWHFWAEHRPEDVDENPAYFDKVASDLADLNMGDPPSAVGATFRLFLGHPLKKFSWAEFMVLGIDRQVSPTGIPDYRLIWDRITPWTAVDVEARKRPPAPVVQAFESEPSLVPHVRWNVGNRQFEVMIGEEVVYADVDRAICDRWAEQNSQQPTAA